jgi:hypothetical protein
MKCRGSNVHGDEQLVWLLFLACAWVVGAQTQQAPRTDPMEGTSTRCLSVSISKPDR